ncbi:MAG: hypothetical protein IT291_05845 [Deltaproteobacteria bacterium]|nr:hypothetical protein [Deltaproteobacteria bacterium]
MAEEKPKTTAKEKFETREDVAEFIAEIAARVAENKVPSLHTMLALDRLLRIPNSVEIFDDELKNKAKELWHHIKAIGAELQDPPLLFGAPSSGGAVDGCDTSNKVV